MADKAYHEECRISVNNPKAMEMEPAWFRAGLTRMPKGFLPENQKDGGQLGQRCGQYCSLQFDSNDIGYVINNFTSMLLSKIQFWSWRGCRYMRSTLDSKWRTSKYTYLGQ